MPQSQFRKVLGLALATAVAVTAAGCQRSSEEGSKKGADQSAEAVMRVEVVRPERHTVQRTVGEPGELEAYEITPIHAKVSGYVQKWTVDIGAKVKRGQVLAVLSVPELDAETEQKQATVEESQAKLAQAKASEDVARANLDSAQAKLGEVQAGIKRADADLALWQSKTNRTTQLVSQRAVTPDLLDETRSDLHSAEAKLAEVHAQVKTAEAAVRQGQALLEKAHADVTTADANLKVARFDAQRVGALRGYTTIVAPYDGVITQRHVNDGDLTQPGPHGQPLFTVARDDLVRIVVSVPEPYAAPVKPGNRALIRLQALAGMPIEGKVSRTSWTLDPGNRTLRTEIDVPTREGNLRPGLYAYATVIVEEHKDVLTIPTTAVIQEKDKAFCVTVVDGKAVRRPIKTGLSDGTRTEVTSGLEANDDVVKANAASLVDGQAIEAIKPESQAAAKADGKAPTGAKP